MTDTQNFSTICVQCGMCCDGTLFNRAKIKHKEDEQLAQSIGLTTFLDHKGQSFFRLPCHHFTGCCSIYQQGRPHICGAFLCEPLKSVQKGEMEFEKAEQKVQLAIKLRDEVRSISVGNPVFDNKDIYELDKLFATATPQFIKENSLVFMKIASLKILLISFIKVDKIKFISSQTS